MYMEGKTMKVLRCRDVGFDCEHEIRAMTQDEILQLAAEHAQGEHDVKVTPDMAEKVKTLIEEDS